MPLTLPQRRPSQKQPQAGKKPPLVIGLDPSLTHFAAVCLSLDSDKPLLAETLAPKTQGFERIDQIVFWLDGVIMGKIVKHDIILVREDYAYSANDSADTPLKELGGVVAYHVYRRWGLPIHRLAVPSIKKFMFGKGNAKKQEMMREAFKHFRFEGDEHQTDAFAVAALAKAVISGKTPSQLPAASREAVGSLRAKQHPLTLL